MNNQKCAYTLKEIAQHICGQPWKNEAIDYAVTQLEKLDRLEEWAKIRQKHWSAICLRMTDEDRRSKAAHRIIGRQAELYSLEEFLTGDEQSLKILAEDQ